MIEFRVGGSVRDVSPVCMNGNGLGNAPGVLVSCSATKDDSGEGCI